MTLGCNREVSCNLSFRRRSNAGFPRMKLFRSLVLALVATPVVAFAQQDEERRAPPIEIPDFSNLDEYIYEPRSVLA